MTHAHSTPFEERDKEQSGEPLPYSFGRSGQMSNEQIRAIALVNDGIARKLANTMGAWLRSQVQIGLASTEPLPFSDYLRVMPDRVYACVLRLEPLGGMALLELELPLILAIVDVLLGGSGTSDGVREVTEIEETILDSVLSVIMRDLNAAWEKVGLRFSIERRESVTNVARLFPPGERTLTMTFLMQLQDTRGTFKLCLPAVVLNTIHRRLVSVNEQPQRQLEGASERVEELAGEAAVRAQLRLPPVKISSRQLQALTPGYVLELPLPRYTMAELLVNGRRVRAAVPVGRGEQRAAMIQQQDREKRVHDVQTEPEPQSCLTAAAMEEQG